MSAGEPTADMAAYEGKTEPAATWFLYSEDDDPLGQIYRDTEEAIPARGTQLTDGPGWKRAEVVDYRELTASCAMRRFRVVVRILTPT